MDGPRVDKGRDRSVDNRGPVKGSPLKVFFFLLHGDSYGTGEDHGRHAVGSWTLRRFNTHLAPILYLSSTPRLGETAVPFYVVSKSGLIFVPTCVSVCQERKIRAIVEPTMWNFFIQDRDLFNERLRGRCTDCCGVIKQRIVRDLGYRVQSVDGKWYSGESHEWLRVTHMGYSIEFDPTYIQFVDDVDWSWDGCKNAVRFCIEEAVF